MLHKQSHQNEHLSGKKINNTTKYYSMSQINVLNYQNFRDDSITEMATK